MSDSKEIDRLIAQEHAAKVLGQIKDSKERDALGQCIEYMIRFYEADPKKLDGNFDLGFFAETLEGALIYVVRVLRGWQDPWREDGSESNKIVSPKPFDEFGLHHDDARDLIEEIEDVLVRDALRAIMNQAELKQYRTHWRVFGGGRPIVHSRPLEPFDFLFMAKAMRAILVRDHPVRRALESLQLESS